MGAKEPMWGCEKCLAVNIKSVIVPSLFSKNKYTGDDRHTNENLSQWRHYVDHIYLIENQKTVKT